MDPADVIARYADCLLRLGVEERDYPFPFVARHDGSAHAVFGTDGSAEVLVTERGQVLSQQRITDPGRLLYRLMVDVTYDLAWRRQQGAPPTEHDPGRRLFALQRSLMSRLDPLWAGWLEDDHAPWITQDQEPDADPPPPEAAAGNNLAGQAGLAACGIAVVLVLTAHVWVFVGWNARAELSRTGTSAEARVISLTPHRTPGQADIWRVHYRFAGPDGAMLEGSEKVDRQTYDSLRPGDLVTVRYRPGKTRQARLARNDRWADQAFLLVLVDLALALTGVAIWRSARRL